MYCTFLAILADATVPIGGNYSAGEKQLLALCRALVKNSRIIVLVSFALLTIGTRLITIREGRGDEQR